MKQALNAFSLIVLISFTSVIQAAAPLTYRCVDVISKRGFQFEIPANGQGKLKINSGFPVRTRGELSMTGFGSKTSFRFGNEIEGGMFRNGIFYYHRHDTGTGTKIVNGTCKVI
ncbi:MAG: hypothetical protein ACPHT7_02000 [Litorivicinaceae bacterium]